LARESGALLVGESASPALFANVKKIIESDPAVVEVGDLLTMQLGPEQVLLAADIKFQPDLSVQELESAIDRLEQKIRKQEPVVKRIFLEAESLRRKRPHRAA
jgi:divalent metal cation (Fe/Co/Zn/Cd) transporter